jgi:hypothetical protein
MVFVGLALAATPALAKRTPPADVAAIVLDGKRYEAPHFNNPCEQNGGCVVARDDASGSPLWAVKVYCTRYDSSLEADVQDVFITTMTETDGRLTVTNEKGLHFSIDLAGHTVTGDSRGCSSGGGCSYGAGRGRVPGGLIAAGVGVVLAWRKRRRAG